MAAGTPRWRERIAFRDALQADPKLASDYASLKRALGAEHVDDRAAYTDAKAAFVHTILDPSP